MSWVSFAFDDNVRSVTVGVGVPEKSHFSSLHDGTLAGSTGPSGTSRGVVFGTIHLSTGDY
jgi:hypothetical protein